MKNIAKLTAAALLVAGTIACTDHNKPAEGTTTDQPAAVSATESGTTDVTATTAAPTDPAPATDPTATTTDAPAPTATDATTPPTQQ